MIKFELFGKKILFARHQVLNDNFFNTTQLLLDNYVGLYQLTSFQLGANSFQKQENSGLKKLDKPF